MRSTTFDASLAATTAKEIGAFLRCIAASNPPFVAPQTANAAPSANLPLPSQPQKTLETL